MVRTVAVAASGAIWIRRAEGHELAMHLLHLHATIGVDVDDRAQRAVEAVALFRGKSIQLLEREGFVTPQQGVPVAL